MTICNLSKTWATGLAALAVAFAAAAPGNAAAGGAKAEFFSKPRPFQSAVATGCDTTFCVLQLTNLDSKTHVTIRNVSCVVSVKNDGYLKEFSVGYKLPGAADGRPLAYFAPQFTASDDGVRHYVVEAPFDYEFYKRDLVVFAVGIEQVQTMYCLAYGTKVREKS